MKKEQRKNLAIVGTASTKKDAPYGDDEWEVWGMSSLSEDPEAGKLDKIFEFHPRRYWGQLPVTMRLNRFDGPVVMQDHYDEIPNSVAYPKDAMREEFYLDVMGANLYVTNSITWMILLALHEGYHNLALYGVHMKHDSEYAYQRPSCSWALGIIHGKILAGEPYSLYISDESELLKARYEYGFDEPSELMLELDTRLKRLRAGLKQSENEKAKAAESELVTNGAIQEAKYWYDRVSGFR